jgi:hypothetical protein
VLVIDGATSRTSCRYHYEVQVYANDLGQIVAVNLLTPSGSVRSNPL